MKTLFATAAAALLLAAPASADTLLHAAPGARNVDQSGGWTAWAEPAGDRFRLAVRAPDGTVSRPAVADFGAAPDPTVAATRADTPALVPFVVYSRCEGTSTVAGCDVFRLDLRSGAERRVPGASSPGVSETAPSAEGEVFTFVRRGGPRARQGVHFVNLRRGPRGPRPVTADLPRETRTNGSRVAYVRGGSVVVRLLNAPRRRAQVFGGQAGARSLVMDRYRVGWLLDAGVVRRTGRFGGSGPGTTTEVQTASRTLPPTTDAIALVGGDLRLFTDGEGVKRAEPAPSWG